MSHPYPFSLDVNALNTSISVQDAIEAICDYARQTADVPIPNDVTCIRELLIFIFKNTYFKFKEDIHKQIRGLLVGSSISGTLAIIFVYKLELQTITTVPISLYRCYIDDIRIITTNKEEACSKNNRVLEKNFFIEITSGFYTQRAH